MLGATVSDSAVDFEVWAPNAREVSVIFTNLDAGPLRLVAGADGRFRGRSTQARSGTTYRYQLGQYAHPDPYSRHQPEGPHGPSMVVDPSCYRWQDSAWRGLDPARQVIYEMHIGTFTPDGTYASAAAQLPALRDLGITSVELMPVAEFVGEFGWGYDGVNWFAPYHCYGTPDDLRRFVDQAHAAGLGVVLDVVYNHFGADGNYLAHFGEEYFTQGNENPWGATINYASEQVRRLAIDNAAYWIREFHMDGLRLDATQNIHDPSHPSLLASLVSEARAAAGQRSIVISGEDYLQRTPLLSPAGADLDHLWNDDFHHSCRVALTGNHSGYFSNYRGHAQEILSTLRHGYLFQGQYDAWGKAGRGWPVSAALPRTCFVAFTQNHDQIANTLEGRRITSLTGAPQLRAITAVLLLGPHTPMLFMGQEFNASSLFAYFADYSGEVARQLWSNRRKELHGFDQYMEPAAQACVLDPCSRDTVRRSTLNFAERDTNAATYRLYRDLLALRRDDVVLAARPQSPFDGALLNEHAFVVRWSSHESGDRMLLVNLGGQMPLRAIAEPLLAPPHGRRWRMIWSSEDPLYGGLGAVAPNQDQGWQMTAHSAALLIAE